MDQLGEATVVGGRFRLVEPVGTGESGGGVWRAVDQVAGGEVAVKVLRAYPADDTVARARFRLVARTVLLLSGPGIALVRDFGEAAQPDGMAAPYLVRELAGGQTLDQRLAEAPLAASDVLRIVAAVAAALAVGHRSGVPHGHIVPANIVLGSGSVTVTDFGLAALTHQPAGGAFSGGLSYVAPELAGGGPATPAADMYALGVIFVACLAGITSRARPSALPGADAGVPLGALELEALPAGLASLWAACLGPNPAERPTATHAAMMSRQVLHRGSGAAAWSAVPGSAVPGSAVPGSAVPPAPPEPGSEPAPVFAPGSAAEPRLVPGRAPGPRLVAVGDESDVGRDGLTAPRERRRRWRRARLMTLGGVAAAATVAVALLVSSLTAQRAAPASSSTTARTSAASAVAPGLSATGRAPAPETTSSVLTTPAPQGDSSLVSSTPAPLSARAALGQLSQTIRTDMANGQIRRDVGVDLDNLIAPVQAELAAGERSPVGQLVDTLRAKVATRESEGAMTAAAASVLTGELDALERSAAG